MDSQQLALLEEYILHILVYKPECQEFLQKLEDEQFQWTNPSHQEIYNQVNVYIKENESPPQQAIYYLMSPFTNQGTKGQLIRDVLRTLQEITDVSVDFVRQELEGFLTRREIEKKSQRILEKLDEGESLVDIQTDLQSTLDRCLGLNREIDDSLDLNDIKNWEGSFEKEDSEKFPTGIDALDEAGVYVSRGELCIMVGSTGSGKSWYLTQVGKEFTRHYGKTILHVTFELSKEQTQARLAQAIFGRIDEEFKKVVSIDIPTFNGKIEYFPKSIQNLSMIDKKNYFTSWSNDFPSKFKYRIEHFPARTQTVSKLKTLLNRLKQTGFVPDVMIIDHCDDMLVDKDNMRIDTGILFKDLRGLASSYNLAVYTATQANRQGMMAKKVALHHIAEDISKAFTADIVMTLTKNKLEEAQGRARVMVCKGRNVPDGFEVEILQSYPLGQFALDSRRVTVEEQESDARK